MLIRCVGKKNTSKLSGTILARQDAAVSLIRSVEIPRAMFFCALHDMQYVVFKRCSSLNGNEQL
eukprot:3010095-Pyramimonas_sp.AAC.1